MAVEWMTSPDRTALRGLAGLADELGVLSVYVTADPREESGPRPAWQVRVRGELAALVERAKADGPRRRWVALTERLARLHTDLAELLDAATPGLGRALFVPVGRDEVHGVSLQVPMVGPVVCEPTACVRPLIAAWQAHGPAGVLGVSGDGVRVLELRFGQVREVAVLAYTSTAAQRRELAGPPAANPALDQRSAAQRDLFDRREDEHLARFLRSAGPRVAAYAAELDWADLVVTGDPRLVAATVAGLPASAPPVLRLDHVVGALPGPRVGAAVGEELDAVRRQRGHRLAEQARDAALAGGPATVGLGDTLGALHEGRVAHLLLDGDGRWCGSRTPDGRLVPAGEVPPGATAEGLVAERRLGERMIELAFRDGAAVTVLDPGAAEPLEANDGVAALLRW